MSDAPNFVHTLLLWSLKLQSLYLSYICEKVCVWTNCKVLPFHPHVTVLKYGRSYELQICKFVGCTVLYSKFLQLFNIPFKLF